MNCTLCCIYKHFYDVFCNKGLSFIIIMVHYEASQIIQTRIVLGENLKKLANYNKFVCKLYLFLENLLINCQMNRSFYKFFSLYYHLFVLILII